MVLYLLLERARLAGALCGVALLSAEARCMSCCRPTAVACAVCWGQCCLPAICRRASSCRRLLMLLPVLTCERHNLR